MKSAKNYIIIALILFISYTIVLYPQPMPQYELSIQNPVLIGSIYQFDVCIKRIGSNNFRIGNSQFILSFNTANFSSPTISRVVSSELIGTGFFFDQIIWGNELRISLGGNGSYINASDISLSEPGTRISSYQITGVDVPIVSTGMLWINYPSLIRTGVSEIDISNNYHDITDITGNSHLNGGGEFSRISGYKFNDLNGNGIWEQISEPPLNGWEIKLQGTNGLYTALTGSSSWLPGYYEFINLTPGSYTINETLQDGWVTTISPVNPLVVAPGQHRLNNNFGNFNGPIVRGMVFNDLNANSLIDIGENGLEGWQIEARKVGTNDQKIRISDSEGRYIISFLPSESGIWEIKESVQANWIQTFPSNPSSYTIDVQSGTNEIGKDFGSYLPSSIRGTKYNDLNGNSVKENGEPGIGGWKIYLKKNGNLMDSLLTDYNGEYIFDSLSTGSYAVDEMFQSGWVQTSPISPAYYSILISQGGTILTERDFGNFRLGSISGLVYYDINHNGIQDVGETGMAEIQINALGPLGSQSVSTIVGGSWSFPAITAGTYIITEKIPTGYHLTQPTEEQYNVLIASGTNVSDLKFGNSAAADTNTYRTFSYDSMAHARDLKGRLGYIKRIPNKVEFCANFTNRTGYKTYFLRVNFRVPIYNNDPRYPFNVNPTPTSITVSSTYKQVDMTWADSIPNEGAVTICGWGKAGKLQTASFFFRKVNSRVDMASPAQFTLNQLRLPMPNAANVYFEDFLQNGFGRPDTGGLIVGIPRPDSSKSYGWVRVRTASDISKSFSDRTGFHTDATHGFYLLGRNYFVREQKSLPPRKHNNLVFADVASLKINIVASALGITPRGLGELIFDDGVNPLSGMTLTKLVKTADTSLTFWRTRVSADYKNIDSVIRKINRAFEGPIDTFSFAQGLRFKGVRKLIDIPFLRANPNITPAIKPMLTVLEEKLPKQFQLYQNYPNPFNPLTTIEFDVPMQSFVTLKVYNMLGQEVAALIDNEMLDEGMQSYEFNACDFASGVYFYRLIAQTYVDDEEGIASEIFTSVKKMILIK